ncbi:MAG: hypothetical protein Q8K96_11210 [Rubrivivax sp.]|nr:hypothetical protein [Rubrivivax sp.]
MYTPPKFPRPPLRRRLLIALLAVATAIVVAVMILKQPAGTHRGRPLPAAVLADAPRCTEGQTEGCVGGMAAVIPTVPASAAR